MTDHHNNLRATGRTHRMLRDAIAQAFEGKTVYVMAAHLAHACDLIDRAVAILEPVEGWRRSVGNAIEFKGGGLILFKGPGGLCAGRFDWERFEIPGSVPGATILADHYAIEAGLSKALEMLHRYDDPNYRPVVLGDFPEEAPE